MPKWGSIGAKEAQYAVLVIRGPWVGNTARNSRSGKLIIGRGSRSYLGPHSFAIRSSRFFGAVVGDSGALAPATIKRDRASATIGDLVPQLRRPRGLEPAAGRC